jgi:hypothetical protein
MSGLFFDYENEDFPTAVLPNAQHRLSVAWDDILWAARRCREPGNFAARVLVWATTRHRSLRGWIAEWTDR